MKPFLVKKTLIKEGFGWCYRVCSCQGGLQAASGGKGWVSVPVQGPYIKWVKFK
jgi:hypothetical protein